MIVFVFVVGSMWWGTHRQTAPTATAPLRSMAEIHSDWEVHARVIIEQYTHDQDATKARDALLALTVSNQDRDVDMALVLALEARRQHQADADMRWKKAMDDFSKLPL